MTVKIRALAVAALALGIAPRAASAHPEFSALGTNRYVTAALLEGRIDVSDALLEGALVSGDERRRLDADGDGQISELELRAGEERLRAEGPAVAVEVDGRALSATVSVSIDLGDEPRASAAPLVVERRLSLPRAWAAGARRLRILLTRDPPKLLDTEIGLVVGPGYAIASGADRITFRGPRVSALEERAAMFEIAGPPPTSSRRGKVAWAVGLGVAVVAAVIAAAAGARRRSRRSA